MTEICLSLSTHNGDDTPRSFDGYLCHRDYQGYHSSLVAMVWRTRWKIFALHTFTVLLIREEALQMDVACDDMTEGVNVRKLYRYGRYDKCNCACRSCDKVHSCPGGRMTAALCVQRAVVYNTSFRHTATPTNGTRLHSLYMSQRATANWRVQHSAAV